MLCRWEENTKVPIGDFSPPSFNGDIMGSLSCISELEELEKIKSSGKTKIFWVSL